MVKEELEKRLEEVLTKGYINVTHREAKELLTYARKQSVQLRIVQQQVYTSVHLA